MWQEFFNISLQNTPEDSQGREIVKVHQMWKEFLWVKSLKWTSDFRRCPKCLFHDCRRSFAVFDICRYVDKCHYYQMPLYQMPLCRQLPLFLLPLRLMPFDTFARVTFATLYTIATMRNAMICLLPLWDKCRSGTNALLGQRQQGVQNSYFYDGKTLVLRKGILQGKHKCEINRMKVLEELVHT